MDSFDKTRLLLLRAAATSFGGLFFSIVSLGFVGHLLQATESLWLLVPTGAVAGAVVVSFFSAKRVALVGAAVGSIASLIYVIASPVPPSPWHVLAACGALGLLAGVPTSQLVERRQGTTLIVGSGLVMGAAAGGGVGAIVFVWPVLEHVVVITFLMALLFIMLVQPFIYRFGPRFKRLLPHWLGIGLVAGTIAAVVGVGMWMLAVTRSFGVDPELKDAVQAMLEHVPLAGLGGLLGGAAAGAVLELLQVKQLERL
ncbi:MAG: hypothetical protein QNJ87_05700 [Gammaproteobacteria bacterium]|nr:hypothetical protein [Gammaproteobacteria bacterium]MDJ0871243.1 hypothetical protein [Gammaproteobacteria bacterium]MDJ0891087.1 hypothetical protein [Gammaproteobacteria bacterium]